MIETGSTKENIRVEVCSKCHPFFTGKQKMVDTKRRYYHSIGFLEMQVLFSFLSASPILHKAHVWNG